MSRARNKLTAMQIKKAGPGTYQDGGGLSLKKTETAGKWIYRYSISGRRRDMGLGTLADVSLSEARQQRDKWQAVLGSGKDPIAERDRLFAAEMAELDRQDPTLEEVARTVFEARKAGLRGDGERGRWFSPIQLYVLPELGNRRISEIHQKDIHKALSKVWRSKPPTAEKAIQRLGIIFKQARLMGLDVDPFTVDAARHMLGEVRHKTKSITATPWQEIPDLYPKLEGLGSSRLALRFLILTAVRGMGVRGARFDEIDGDLWTVPADRIKGREGRVEDFRVPLSFEALKVVEEAKATRRSDYLFPSYRSGCITDVAVAKVLNQLGEAGRPHGFRTSFRTWVQDTEASSYDVAETALGHILGNKVERSYARSDLLDQRQILMQRWADFVTGAEAKVIPLRGVR
ncbi:Prophage integrase IntA [Phaeobacter piscinae]|nr:Prophage integrase IntA [Phaeobacter piscinae]